MQLREGGGGTARRNSQKLCPAVVPCDVEGSCQRLHAIQAPWPTIVDRVCSEEKGHCTRRKSANMLRKTPGGVWR